MSRRNVLVVVVAAVAAVAAWVLSRDSDEDAIRKTILRAAASVTTSEEDTNPIVRLARIKSALKETCEKEVRVSAEEVRGLPATMNGLDAIAGAGAQGLGIFQRASLDVSSFEIKIDDARRSAQVTTKATFEGVERGGRPRIERRDATFFVTKSDHWRISSVTVWAQKE